MFNPDNYLPYVIKTLFVCLQIIIFFKDRAVILFYDPFSKTQYKMGRVTYSSCPLYSFTVIVTQTGRGLWTKNYIPNPPSHSLTLKLWLLLIDWFKIAMCTTLLTNNFNIQRGYFVYCHRNVIVIVCLKDIYLSKANI